MSIDDTTFDNTAFNEDSELQYSFTFEHNHHDELMIDHELVKASSNEINEEAHESIEESDEETNKLPSLELPTFNPICNHYPLHRGYAKLPHEFQLGIISPLSLFQLFFTDKQLRLIVENSNTYEQVKGREAPGQLHSNWYSKVEPFALHIQSTVKRFYVPSSQSIGACGTVRTNSASFPKELKIGKEMALDWDTLFEKVVNDVLAVF
ncbi:8111_t:CDS:2 [Cetraspora pellucida]|uniref:8111_t:CDS:1 n=1 Tax=Cetraspora pellucida TaxID=1433469 RepID=A0A9N9NUK8_9GLOM|nr:8111_t:CDS:2 [Cetraspora pellucida]